MRKDKVENSHILTVGVNWLQSIVNVYKNMDQDVVLCIPSDTVISTSKHLPQMDNNTISAKPYMHRVFTIAFFRLVKIVKQCKHLHQKVVYKTCVIS